MIKTLILCTMILLVSLGADATKAEAPLPWVILVYECDRPVGILLNTDPPRWFLATEDLTPYVATQIRLSIEAKRAVPLIVGHTCGDKIKV